jgi:hypothetical protein
MLYDFYNNYVFNNINTVAFHQAPSHETYIVFSSFKLGIKIVA